jgi:acetyltransferase-like isoleucine patch superfamily enzyme
MSIVEQRTLKSIVKSIWTHALSDLAMFTFPYPVTNAVHRLRGVKIGKHCHISRGVLLDDHNPELIEIGNGVYITYGVKIICHKRDMSYYDPPMDGKSWPFKESKVVLEDDCHIGISTIIMPGVTIGKGAIVGAGSLVTHDIPPYCLAVGSPAKVVKQFTVNV